jgi:hypothetical protein
MGSPDALGAWKNMDEIARKHAEKGAMNAWRKWADKNKDKIVNEGAPLGKTKRVDSDGISDIRNEMGAYTVVQAENHDEAAKLFIDHPHFTMFPGERVEVMEILPMPTMPS